MIEAVVQTGAFETTYRRAGSGAPVILLEDGPGGDAYGGWLFDGLATRFRTVATLPPDAARGPGPGAPGVLEAWLRGLIDGLGLERPGLVAGAAHGGSLLRFAGIDPERLHRLVLIRERCEPACPAEAGRTHREPGAAVPHPVLLCPRPSAEPADRAQALVEIVEFLGRGR